MKNIIKTVLVVMLSVNLAVYPVVLPVSNVYAVESPSSPELPEAPEQPNTSPTPTVQPSEAPAGTLTPEPTLSPSPTPTVAPTPEAPETPEAPREPGTSPTPRPTKTPKPSPSPTPSPEISETSEGSTSGSSSGGISNDGVVGDPIVITGDANASGAISNSGNDNYSATTSDGDGSSASIVTEGNGENTTNTGSVALSDNESTNQNNIATVDNSLFVDTDTGSNSTSKNVGTSNIETGNANSTGTILNSVNTNVDGVMISEFDISDDQTGDYVLDFETNCIIGCGGGDLVIVNDGNGTESTNSANLQQYSDSSTFQNNDADIQNTLELSANTGNNNADNNVGGDSNISTGDANVSGSVVNFVNNNLAGDILYGVVNIFGDLVGDIIIPEEYLVALGLSGDNTQIANSNNGSGSDNSGSVTEVENEEYGQFNTADIANNLVIEANTGGNSASDNTGGNNSIETGNINIDAQVLNIANTNIIGGTWWLVLVNNAGQWVGKIIGAPGATVGSNFAMAPGTEATSDDGVISVTNSGNGSDSSNTGAVYSETNNSTQQTNDANIVNNINLSANTGDNSTSRNTGGDNTIVTGDANVMLNLVNFVNNNFANSRVVVTVVNIFGSWIGDLVTPGATKEEVADSNSSQSETPNNSNSSSSNSSSNSSNNNSNSSNTSETLANLPEVLGTTLFAGQRIKRSTEISTQITDGDAADGGEVEISDTQGEVAGAQASKMRINLAWLLPIIAGFGLVWYARRRYLA